MNVSFNRRSKSLRWSLATKDCNRIGTPENLAWSECRRGKAILSLISQAKGQSYFLSHPSQRGRFPVLREA